MDKTTVNLLWGFFIVHVALYIVTNIILIIINLVGYAGNLWFLMPLIFWGAFIGLHYFINKLLISGFFKVQYQKLLDRLER